MTKGRFVIGHGLVVMFMSLVAAAITHNPNWPWNIPLGFVAGSLFGLVMWEVWKRL